MMHQLARLAIAAAISAACAASAQTLRIDDVRVIDPQNGRVSEAQSVFVDQGRIVASLAQSPDNVIDGEGRYLLPGLAEMHAHVPPYADTQRVDDVLQLFLAHGVTTVRGMLGEPGHLLLRDELARGERLGPRLITSGPSVNGNSAPNAEAAATLVREQAEAGYDFVKLHPGLIPETFAAIVETARENNIPFAGHVAQGVGLERALAAGQATIDHLDAYAQMLVQDGTELPEDIGFFGVNLAANFDPAKIMPLAEQTRDAGVWNVPTQTLLENLATGDLDTLQRRPAMRYIDTGTRAQWALRVAQMQATHSPQELALFIGVRRELIRALHAAGAELLLGADAPQIMNVPGDALHHELELLVAAGLTPAEALATGTSQVARFFKDPAMGCLRAGCIADAVLLASNPLEDISAVRSVQAVMRAGRWLDRGELDARLEGIAARAAQAD